MFSRRRLFIFTGTALVLALSAVSVSAQKPKATPEPPRPPSVALEADTQVVTICPEDQGSFPTRIRLRANANSPDGNPLRYRWTVTGGQVVGSGTEVIWDLTDARPGTYRARIDVESGPSGDPLCQAFTELPIIVRACPPPRPYCPSVAIYCPDTVPAGQPVTFTANVSGGTPNINPTYNWTVSAGTITSGQGTTSITVDTAGLGGRPITAKVEVMGYNLECNASCTTQVPERPISSTFDEYGNIARDDEKARLDNFAVALQNAPGARGYYIIYPGRNTRPGEADRRAAFAREYLMNTRGIESRRIVTLVGAPSDALTIRLWIVPEGADPPPMR